MSVRTLGRAVIRGSNPRRKRVHTKKFDRCVSGVKEKGIAKNAYAVCGSALGERGSILAAHRRKNPEVRYYVGVSPSGQTSVIATADNAGELRDAYSGVYAYLIGPFNSAEKAIKYKPVSKDRKKNPAPEDSRRAARLYENFHGEPAQTAERVSAELPRAAVLVGRVDAIDYTTVRDGQIQAFRHKFHKKSAPDLIAGARGYPLLFSGGRYSFTDRGIIDA